MKVPQTNTHTLTHDVNVEVPLVLPLVVPENDGVGAALLPARVDHRQAHVIVPGIRYMSV